MSSSLFLNPGSGMPTRQALPNPATLGQRLDKFLDLRPVMPSQAMYGDPVGQYNFLTWNDVDQNYRNRTIVTLAKHMTAYMKNAMHGMPLVILCTQVTISHEIHWRELHVETVLAMWDDVGPTGIARNLHWTSWSSEGSSNRYKKRQEIPLASLADPNYGADQLWHELEAIRQSADYHIMVTTALTLSHAPMRFEREAWKRKNPGKNYSFFNAYNRIKGTLFLAAASPGAFGVELTRVMNSAPFKDTLIFGDSVQYQMRTYATDERAYPNKMIDVTQGDQGQLAAARTIEDLETHSDLRLNIGNVAGIAAVKCPSFQRHSDEPLEFAEQPLRRHVALAHSYIMPVLSYSGHADTLDENRCTVPVVEVRPNHALEVRVKYGQAARSNGLGFAFKQNAAGKWEQSQEYKDVINKFNRADNRARKAIAAKPPRDANDVGDTQLPRPTQISELAFRAQPLFSHLPKVVVGTDPQAAFTEYVGQLENYFLPNTTLLDMARLLERRAMGMNETERKAFVARTLAVSTMHADGLMHGFKALSIDGDTDKKKQLQAAFIAYRGIKTIDGTASVLEQQRLNRAAVQADTDAQNAETIAARDLAAVPRPYDGTDAAHVLLKGTSDTSTATATRLRTAANTARTNARNAADLYRQVDEIVRHDAAGGVHIDTTADVAGLVGINATSKVIFKSGIYPLLTRLPNAGYEALEPLAGTFARLEQEQPENFKALYTQLSNKIAAFADNAGHAETYAKVAAEKLKEIGVVPLAKGAALPNISSADVTKFKSASLSASALAKESRLEEHSSPAYSLSSALKARALESHVPLAAIRHGQVDAGRAVTDTAVGSRYLEDDRYPLSHSRTKAATDLDGLGGLALLFFVGICATPLTPDTVAHFSTMGIMLTGGRLDRYAMNFCVSSLIAMKRGADTVQTMMTPMMSTFSTRGADGWADFNFMFQLGFKWNSEKNMTEIYGAFPDRYLYGMNSRLMVDVAEFRAVFQSQHHVASRTGRADLCFWPEPLTETERFFPQDLTGSIPVDGGRAERGAENDMHMASTAYATAREILGDDILARMNVRLNQDAEAITTGGDVDYSVLVERAFCRYWDGSKFKHKVAGTGPLGAAHMNDVSVMADVFNGTGYRAFPGQLSSTAAAI